MCEARPLIWGLCMSLVTYQLVAAAGMTAHGVTWSGLPEYGNGLRDSICGAVEAIGMGETVSGNLTAE